MTKIHKKEQIIETDLQEIQIMCISETKFKISMFNILGVLMEKVHNHQEQMVNISREMKTYVIGRYV